MLHWLSDITVYVVYSRNLCELTVDRWCGVQGGGIDRLRLYLNPDYAETFGDEVSKVKVEHLL